MTGDLVVVQDAINRLRAVAGPSDCPALDALGTRVANRRLRVLVAGEAKRGKSTLINTLIGKEVLPVGVVPVTAVATTVRWDPEDADHLVVTQQDGRRWRGELSQLAGLVSEKQNSGNARGVATVDVVLNAGRLAEQSVELVDTPGTGSVFEHNTVAAQRAFDTLDAAIVVLTADPPISAAERDLLRRVSSLAVRTFVVLNKSDQLTAAELGEATAFTTAVCGDACGRPVTVYPLSARRGDGDPGCLRFQSTFARYLAEHAGADTAVALRTHTRRLTARLFDEVTVRRRALDLARSSAGEKVTAFAARLTAIEARAEGRRDRCRAVEDRLRRSLDESARQLSAQLAIETRQRVAAGFSGPLAAGDPVEMERQGRLLLIGTIRDRVEGWRFTQAEVLRTGLADLLADLSRERDAQLRLTREAARDLLEVRLTDTPSAPLVGDDAPFWYSFEPSLGWEAPFTRTARRLAPGRAERARRRVIAEAAGLADRQVGRARAHLQQRLTESVRHMIAAMRAEHEDTLGRLQGAISDSVAEAASTSAEVSTRQRDLTARQEVLRCLLTQLDGEAPRGIHATRPHASDTGR